MREGTVVPVAKATTAPIVTYFYTVPPPPPPATSSLPYYVSVFESQQQAMFEYFGCSGSSSKPKALEDAPKKEKGGHQQHPHPRQQQQQKQHNVNKHRGYNRNKQSRNNNNNNNRSSSNKQSRNNSNNNNNKNNSSSNQSMGNTTVSALTNSSSTFRARVAKAKLIDNHHDSNDHDACHETPKIIRSPVLVTYEDDELEDRSSSNDCEDADGDDPRFNDKVAVYSTSSPRSAHHYTIPPPIDLEARRQEGVDRENKRRQSQQRRHKQKRLGRRKNPHRYRRVLSDTSDTQSGSAATEEPPAQTTQTKQTTTPAPTKPKPKKVPVVNTTAASTTTTTNRRNKRKNRRQQLFKIRKVLSDASDTQSGSAATEEPPAHTPAQTTQTQTKQTTPAPTKPKPKKVPVQNTTAASTTTTTNLRNKRKNRRHQLFKIVFNPSSFLKKQRNNTSCSNTKCSKNTSATTNNESDSDTSSEDSLFRMDEDDGVGTEEHREGRGGINGDRGCLPYDGVNNNYGDCWERRDDSVPQSTPFASILRQRYNQNNQGVRSSTTTNNAHGSSGTRHTAQEKDDTFVKAGVRFAQGTKFEDPNQTRKPVPRIRRTRSYRKCSSRRKSYNYSNNNRYNNKNRDKDGDYVGILTSIFGE